MTRHKRHTQAVPASASGLSDLADEKERQRRFDAAAIAVLLVLGIFLSVNYFGHKLVPTSDFPGFTATSRTLLSGRMPGSFKRAPVHGALVAGISLFTKGSTHPDLTAGWILNAVLYPFLGVFVYLIAGRFIGGLPAALLAAVAAVNPWTIAYLRDPICEIDLLFFFLLAFYLMVRRSRWCYFVAAIASMVRYEGAGIIVCVFLVDILSTRDKKEWLRSLACAAGAMIPLALWLVATFIKGLKPGDTHYLSELGEPSHGRIIIGTFIDLLWQVAYKPLLVPPAYIKSLMVRPSGQEIAAIDNSFRLVQFAAAFTFACGAAWAVWKRNWPLLAMMLFLLMYLMVHAVHAFAFHRFLTAVYWIVLLGSCVGMQAVWRILDRDHRIPRSVVAVIQIGLLVALAIWIGGLLRYYGIAGQASRRSVSVFWVALAAAGLCAGAWVLTHGRRQLRPAAMMYAAVAAILFSNQFSVALVVQNGKEDDEFRQVVDWYARNARPGEKLACSMFMVLQMIDEKNASSFLPLPATGTEHGDLRKFTETCYKWNVAYVVWDSRLGFSYRDRYFRLNGLNDIQALAEPRDTGPYEFLVKLKSDYSGRYVHIFRLAGPRSPSPPGSQP